MNGNREILDWLLEGDPSIRWQVMRDLLGRSAKEYMPERTRIATEGWGGRFLSLQDPEGTWGGGLYGPKWISTTYTLLSLRRLGLSPDHQQTRDACQVFLNYVYHDGGINLFKSMKSSEICVTGMLLSLLSYFKIEDERIDGIAAFLLGEQMDDGGWNCEVPNGATHGSFHTTLSVLEGLHEYASGAAEPIPLGEAVSRAHEFLLRHRLYKSHRTGQVFDPAMTRMPFPPRWRYDFIRALDYFQFIGAPKDDRMADAIDLLKKKRKRDGRWNMNSGMSGRIFFDMEKAGKPSRWNTLRALRILKWWEGKT
ncbi:MAG: hypothetical protein JXA13_04860 [Anaerolineales bacterium]|nr:hypothetical protein [Anaerolineales bacterium]